MVHDDPLLRRPILTGAGVVWLVWLLLMASGDRWSLFFDNWFMSVTMAFGSFVAGSTCVGSGAVAFPVMTLLFAIEPGVARDFSLLIQSVGMIAASFTIVCLRVPVAWRAVLWGGLGGVVGIVLGFEVVFPILPPQFAKMLFTSCGLSFAAALFWINRDRGRETLGEIPSFQAKHALLLLAAGVVGGTVSGVVGTGLNIVVFSLLVLAFRICERVATPTSVILMGMNALAGVAWKLAAGSTGVGLVAPLASQAWPYWYVCVPIVVVGAPCGAWFIRGRSRLFVARFLYLLIAAQFIAALVTIRQTPALLVFSGCVLVIATLFFYGMATFGAKRLDGLRTTGRRPPKPTTAPLAAESPGSAPTPHIE